MCLDRLEKFPVRKNKDGWVVAWKVFYSQIGQRLKFSWRDGGVGIGTKVHVAKGKALLIDEETTYQAGFHAYTNKQDAVWMAGFYGEFCRRVLLKDITATGWQNGFRVIVARKMIVPKEG